MIVFGIQCNFFIVLPIWLENCRSSVFFVFYKAKWAHLKNQARLRDFPRFYALDRHWARNLSSHVKRFIWKERNVQEENVVKYDRVK